MRQKFVFVTAIAVCLSLALVPAFANERAVDRSADRTKAGKARGADVVQSHEFSDLVRQMPAGSRVSGSNNTAANKAAALISAAAKQEGDAAIATLQQVIQMDLQSNDQTDKIRSGAHEMLANLYEGSTSKQVRHLGMALQYSSDPARRARIEARIGELGGDVFSVQFNQANTTSYDVRDAGPDDSCLGAVAVSLPHSETMSITPSGDVNWRSFDIAGPDGAFATIRTISDNPGSFEDDTDLGLWAGCPENGGTQLAFNDDAGGDFTSQIDSDCLAPGTYYVEVGGFFDTATPDNFDLTIELTGTCVVPQPDSFEPDNARADAGDIGHPTATSGNGWGRAKKDIQARSIFPAGDVDNADFRLTQNSLVRMSTAGQHPTFFNGFQGTGALDNPDTVMGLFFENEPDYGGRCNQPDLGFLPICQTDADCPVPLDNPLPGFPPCIPAFLFGGIEEVNPLAVNDDRGGGDFGSELIMCLPRTASGTPSATLQLGGGDFTVQVVPFSGSDSFDYELQVKNEVGCLFENEPNGEFELANDYAIGSVVSGIYDFVVTNPYSDADLYRFDVDDVAAVAFQTFAPDTLQSDTALDLYVGPDDAGDFFYTGVSDEDGGSGFLSALAVVLPPASDLLGNATADADYYMNVTSNYFNPNYYYDLASAFIAASSASEAEPNDEIGSANVIGVGGVIIGEIGSSCDVDTFRFQLTENTYINLAATGGGDSAINLVECGSATQISCDDDSNGNMLPAISGCLPAGEYCAQLRAFGAGDTFSYEIQLSGTGGCTPYSPPAMTGDNSFTCLDFQSCP
jgi:hypothetical protein